MADHFVRRIPEPTVVRLPVYQRALLTLSAGGVQTVSSAELAEAAGVNAAKVRKDLSHLGTYGTPGTGYDVNFLLGQVRRELGLDLLRRKQWDRSHSLCFEPSPLKHLNQWPAQQVVC